MSKKLVFYVLGLGLVAALAYFIAMKCVHENNSSAEPVKDFQLDKYLGVWHEIARIENRFEKGCENVTATYTARKEGGVTVLNKCVKDGNKTKEAKGKAFFRGASDVGALKVSFYWPFYGKYDVLYVDSDYQYAIVGGGSEDYFWILAREKTAPDAVLADLVKKGKEFGFPTDKLHYTKQS